MRPQLVIFDMDGLMFDTERIYYRTWQEAAACYGYKLTWEIYVQIVARNSRYIEKVLKGIFGETFPYEEVMTKKRTLSDETILKEGIQKKPGLVTLLDFLEEQGISKAVATSSAREKALRYLKLAKVEDRFDSIICGSDVVESKPNPEIFLRSAKVLKKKSEACMVLEDSRLGIEAAKRAGMYGVFIPDLVEADDEIRQNASNILTSLAEVITLIR